MHPRLSPCLWECPPILSHAPCEQVCGLQLLLSSLLLQETQSTKKAEVGSSPLGTSHGPWETSVALCRRSSFWGKPPAPWEGQA